MNKDELTSLANEEDGMMENETDNDGNNRKLVQRIAKQRGIMTSSFKKKNTLFITLLMMMIKI